MQQITTSLTNILRQSSRVILLITLVGGTLYGQASVGNVSAKEVSTQLRRENIFGDWEGLRTKLVIKGIEPSAFLITDPYANLHGGQQIGASDYNLAGVNIHFKSEQLIGYHGGDFFVGGAVNFGTSLSAKYIGNSYPVQLADVAGSQPRLTYLGYEQKMHMDKLNLRVGRLTVNSLEGEEFMGSDYFKVMTSVGFDLIPQSLFFNAGGASGYPITTWGTRLRYNFEKGFYAQAGLYNSNTKQREGYQHGIDFSLRGPMLSIGEVGWRKYDHERRASVTNVKFGGYYNGGSYMKANDNGEERVSGLYGVYVVADHQLEDWGWRDGAHRHLGVFGAFTAEPQVRVDTVPYFVDGGVSAFGPFAMRPHDIASAGFVYGSFKNAPSSTQTTTPLIQLSDNDEVFEANYAFALRPGVSFQPSVQYLVNPRGSSTIANSLDAGSRVPNALVVGANIVLNF